MPVLSMRPTASYKLPATRRGASIATVRTMLPVRRVAVPIGEQPLVMMIVAQTTTLQRIVFMGFLFKAKDR